MAKILVTGANGLVGSAIVGLFKDNCYKGLNLRTSYKENFDLRKEQSVRDLYELIRPDYVIHCAAVVGGIKFNKEHPDILYRDNILINTHMIHYAHQYNVKKLIAFSSACAFQDGVYPFQEENLQEGKPYSGNLAYGYAKRMVDVQIGVYNNLHDRKDLTVIPTSIYGPQDNFSLDNGHFVSNLITKTFKAKTTGILSIWGDGSPLRELLFSEDLAKILVDLLLKETPDKLIIPGQEVSIYEVAMTISELMGFTGEISWEKERPSGQLRKPTDRSLFNKIMNDFSFTSYKEGLKKTVDWYLSRKLNNLPIRGELNN